MSRFAVAAITDEFTQDFERMCKTAVELGIVGLEVRTAWDRNVVDLSDDEIRRIRALADDHGRKIVGVASPVYKCTHPNGGPVDKRFEQDAFHSAHTFDDQPRILERALDVAEALGAPLVRVFSFWRTTEPTKLQSAIEDALSRAVELAGPRGLTVGIENEHACNLATGAETAPTLNAVNDPALGLVWDPANAYFAGATAFPDDYEKIPAGRVAHVHAKDGVMDYAAGRMTWGDIGTGAIDWTGQLQRLAADGYEGPISLETHWAGPDGDKFLGSTMCIRSLQRLISEV